jgi:uncharacterized protein YegP (UPF0339 family)
MGVAKSEGMQTSTFLRGLQVGFLAVALGHATGCASSAAADDDSSEGAVQARQGDDVISGGGKFEIAQLSDGQWVFNLKAKNGEAVLHSERYASKQNAEKGVASVLRNIFDDAQIVPLDGNAFAVKAKNGQEVARSEQYASPSNRTRAIAAIRTLITGSGEQDSDAPAPQSPGVELPTAELLTVPAGSGYRLRLVDAKGKLVLRMPGGKRLAEGKEFEDYFFDFERMTLLELDQDGLPNGDGMEHVHVEQGDAGGWFFTFGDFSRDSEGLYVRRILMISPKTDYPSEAAATQAAKAAMAVLGHMPVG